MKKSISFFLFSVVILACSPDSQSDSKNENGIQGVYVREQSIEIKHPESGDLIGMRQVRDSIFIKHVNDGYQVINSKWRLNNYDREGWVNMAHADDRPFPSFVANLEEKTNVLNSGNGHTLTIDQNSDKLLLAGTTQLEYKRVGE